MGDIDNISYILGILWEPSKDTLFSTTPTFISFTWDLEHHEVALTEAKQHKCTSALHDWLAKRTYSLHEVQKLLSKLTHASQVLLKGHLFLANLKAMVTVFGNKPFVPHTPPKGTQDDINWWTKQLTTQASPAPIQAPHMPIDPHAFSDASSSVGIGILLQGHWHTWSLQPGWKSNDHDIGWAEAIGFELLMHAVLTASYSNITILIHGDNQGVIEAWHHGHSRNKHINLVFRRIVPELLCTDCSIVLRYIPSRTNPTNSLSHGVSPPLPYSFPPSISPVTSSNSSVIPPAPCQLPVKTTGWCSMPKLLCPTLLSKALQAPPITAPPSPASSSTLSSCELLVEPSLLCPHCAAQDHLITWRLLQYG